MKVHFSLALAAAIFFGCNSAENESEKSEADVVIQKVKPDYRKLGREISAIAQAELMRNVQSALKEGGPVYAISYCNVHATPLSDSISNQFECSIGRISSKNRNPENVPKGQPEIMLMNHYLEKYVDGRRIRDSVVENETEVVYYRPIIVMKEACLKCHGQVGENITEETMVALQEFYPEDKATNYRLGDFRGAWKIRFEK